MTIKNPRINVTFDQEMAGLLAYLARKEHTSMANVVRELTFEALEMHEDLHLSRLANKLDRPDAKTYSHDDAWK